MGATAATKAARILENTQNVIAIEGLAAAQGLELRAPLDPGPATRAALEEVRRVSPHLEEDRPLAPDIAAVRQLVTSGALLEAVSRAIGTVD